MKLTIEQKRQRRRIDLFRVLCLFVLIAMPLSVLYQISVHHLGNAPAVVQSTIPPAKPR